MRSLAKRIISATNLSFRRQNSIRLASSDAQKKDDKESTEEIRKNIVVEKYAGVVTLSIDRRPSRNSLNEETMREITVALDEFEKDPEAKVLVLNGEGGTFCSGFDIDCIADNGYNNLKDAAARLMHRPLCDKPIIAAVTGYAVAEGFELALACDLRVIEDTAVMGCLGRRFGVPLSLYGGRRLVSLIGLSRALDLIMTGRLINGKEANEFGLAAKLTSTGTALGEAVKLAKSLVKFPQNALIMDKLAAVNSQLNPNSEESMRDEALAASLLGNAFEDMKEGVKKFHKGIGKHGKFYNLTEMPLKDWELEDSYEEITICKDPSGEVKDGQSEAKDSKTEVPSDEKPKK